MIVQLPAGGPGHPGWMNTVGGVRILMPQTPEQDMRQAQSEIFRV